MNVNTKSQPPKLEIADIIHAHGQDLIDRGSISSLHRKILKDLAACRTAALGGHIERCDRCAHERQAYNSCRNRHCPKCQGSVAARWMQDRAAELLDVPYFHVVFTLPESIASLGQQNPCLIYNMLFRAASQTLLQVAQNPQHLGAKIGFLSVLHTWGQNLHFHPHLHCVVPSGGLSACGTKWIAGRRKYLLPVRVLSRVFRGKFIALLKRAHRQGRLELRGSLARLTERGAWQHFLNVSVRQDWVVYAKRPFGGPEVVLKYLARYTHRVAISNARLMEMKDGRVTFHVKDYAAGGRRGTLTLTAVEFLRRFLQHVLPKGFVRIRHFGFLCNRFRKTQLQRCRELLPRTSASSPQPASPPTPSAPPISDAAPCPKCERGKLRLAVIVRADPPQAKPFQPHRLLPAICDTS